ncbi:MAG: hypothetical protein SFV18_21375 [Bryobacteraceae bacterium]|nr:hypothetical protein [Bryobacteraceae bacterium]
MGEDGTKVEYVGGTGSWKPGKDLRLSVADGERLRVEMVAVPYTQINQIEYGQKVSRSVLPAVIISPLFLLNKTRKHFLTLGYLDDRGAQQALVFRVPKGDIRAVLASLEARTGLRVTYLDDEARKM